MLYLFVHTNLNNTAVQVEVPEDYVVDSDRAFVHVTGINSFSIQNNFRSVKKKQIIYNLGKPQKKIFLNCSAIIRGGKTKDRGIKENVFFLKRLFYPTSKF